VEQVEGAGAFRCHGQPGWQAVLEARGVHLQQAQPAGDAPPGAEEAFLRGVGQRNRLAALALREKIRPLLAAQKA